MTWYWCLYTIFFVLAILGSGIAGAAAAESLAHADAARLRVLCRAGGTIAPVIACIFLIAGGLAAAPAFLVLCATGGCFHTIADGTARALMKPELPRALARAVARKVRP